MEVTTFLQPGQKGTKRLVQRYGDRLVCVRYRCDPVTGKHYKTVELIYEEIDAKQPAGTENQQKAETSQPGPKPKDTFGVKIEYWEKDLRDRAKAAGGIWRPKHKL